MNILKRFEEERLEDDLDPQQLQDTGEEEEEEENSLVVRLSALGIAVDDASPEAIWDVLTPDERNSFLRTLKDPNSVSALSEQARQGFENDTWWAPTSDEEEEEERRMPEMIEVPASLIPQKLDLSHPRPPLIYNIVSIWSVPRPILRRRVTDFH